jgi:Conserved hypothetical protein (DUF2461)
MAGSWTLIYCGLLRGLADNNEKAWFDARRQEYEEHVREPFVEGALRAVRHLGTADAGGARLISAQTCPAVARSAAWGYFSSALR